MYIVCSGIVHKWRQGLQGEGVQWFYDISAEFSSNSSKKRNKGGVQKY